MKIRSHLLIEPKESKRSSKSPYVLIRILCLKDMYNMLSFLAYGIFHFLFWVVLRRPLVKY